MKIKCEFCGTMMNDTEAVCPSCGAPNPNVRRSSGDQPLTIAALKQWYESHGLPPEETTRFFIGKDIREPRAFGIYFDEKTGNYVVYKNKSSGQRAVRYEGTDEAYAVNELFQRLKQEITQQKMHNVKQRQSSGTQPPSRKKGCLGNLLVLALAGVGGIGALLALLLGFGAVLTRNDPKAGYYTYEGTAYYYSPQDYTGYNWFRCDSSVWNGPLTLYDVPDPLETRKDGKRYYDGEEWSSSLSCPDFDSSVYARDLAAGMTTPAGYYRSDALYYHLDTDYDADWFCWDGQWTRASFPSLPNALQHPSLAADCFLSEAYRDDFNAEDFANTLYYQDRQASYQILKGYYRADDEVFYHLGDYYFQEWYIYENSDWHSIDTRDLPEPLQHPSIVEDFYFTPTWDAATQFTDFETTDFYRDAQGTDSGSDSGDSDFNWDSGDSWDSGDTDWDSDW